MRIALVSDLHLGSVIGPGLLPLGGRPGQCAAARRWCCSSATSPMARWSSWARTCGRCPSCGRPEGTFFVTGNHEFYFDPTVGWRSSRSSASRCWRTKACRVRGLLLAGVQDIAGRPSGRGPDMDAALSTRLPGQPVIMMSHQPNLVYDAIDRDVQLMVSGHTHGGQFYPGGVRHGGGQPCPDRAALGRRYAALHHQRCGFLGPDRPAGCAAGHHDDRADLARNERA